jgi:hypothetical protein
MLGMTDAPELPDITAPKRWRVEMADKTTRVIEAWGFPRRAWRARAGA